MPTKFGHLKRENGDNTNSGVSRWSKEFHVHVDASSIALGAVLAQPGEGDIDHPIAFVSRKLSNS